MTIPGAAAAYSLRLLDSTYTGSSIRVRRASDNAEQDIGFVDNELNSAALATFCGSSNGFVKVWYDQAGSNDATQTSTGSQPKIYDSSTGVVTDNGKPAVEFDGTNDFLDSTFTVNTTDIGISSVQRFLNVAGGQLSSTLSEATNGLIYLLWNNTANNLAFELSKHHSKCNG